MFVKTIKFNKKTAVAIVLAAAAVLILFILLAGRASQGGHANLDAGSGIKTNADRVAYLLALGWSVAETPVSEQETVIPREFTEVLECYNELQKQQGFDLQEYCGLEVTIYTYTVLNYPNATGEVYACLYIHSGQVIAGDIHSAALDGFMHGLK